MEIADFTKILDEKMSDKATKAAVLFANTEHAYLKEKYPLWSDRVKRINNLWRKLSSADRDVFVKKARENRADVPKRRNRRTTSSANKDQLSGSVEDLADVSQDSSRSHLDTVNDAQSNGQHNPPIDPRVNFSQVMGQVCIFLHRIPYINTDYLAVRLSRQSTCSNGPTL